ncbi:hypothetical protein E1B28_010831 [Marasmius oreades]|uniref:Uncharacterized protein n=1 Tax=Marasmius oreades TaxID=181124 RepID=A0A9P7RTH7_9AGAR|nr:uncharacterized protein E1B28_010831 [Marasmius oreades]KAG7089123.1 hypothetical protein E1B28_010831 [Marasmius oreades]
MTARSVINMGASPYSVGSSFHGFADHYHGALTIIATPYYGAYVSTYRHVLSFMISTICQWISGRGGYHQAPRCCLFDSVHVEMEERREASAHHLSNTAGVESLHLPLPLPPFSD